MLHRRHFLASAAALACTAPGQALAVAPRRRGPALPPLAPIRPVVDTLPGGITVTDNYRWMEGAPTNPELAAWLTRHGTLTRAKLDALPGRARLGDIYDRLVDRRDDSFPTQVAGDKMAIVRITKDKPWPRLAFASGGTERLLVDPKATDPTGNFDYWLFTPDLATLAYGVSFGGRENGGVQLLDIASGKTTTVAMKRARATGWTADGRGLFSYRLRPDAVEGATDYRLGGAAWLHRLGTDPASDRIVFAAGEGDRFDPQTSDEPYVAGAAGSRWLVGVHMVNDTVPNQIYTALESEVLAGRRPWRRIADEQAKVERWLHDGERILLLARGRNGLGELVAVDAATGRFETGTVLLAAGADERLHRFAVARDGIYAVMKRASGDRLVRVTRDGKVATIDTGKARRVGTLITDREADGTYFETFDLIVPYRLHHVAGPGQVPVARPMAPMPDVDFARFATTEVEVPARDGALVPLTLVHRPDIKLDGSNPLLVDAYGAYGVGRNGDYDPMMLARVEAGVVYAYAAVRGGGEKGEDWHVAGMKATKPNTWRDAIDCARWLVAKGWTRPGRLALTGASAGGIMMGRAITEAPELFAAAVGHVGVFNPLRFEQSNNGRGNAAEFGTLANPAEVPGLVAMDSVQAVRPGVRYPMTLLTTGLNDPRVDPWVVAKFAAALQHGADGRRRMWLAVDGNSGHAGSSVDARKRMFVDEMAFVLRFAGRAAGG